MATKKQAQIRTRSGTPFKALGLTSAEFHQRLKVLLVASDFESALAVSRVQASRNPLDYDVQRAFALYLAYTSRFDEAATALAGLFRSHAERTGLDNDLFWAMMCALVKTSPAEAVRFVEERVNARTLSSMQGYRWIRYIGQFTGDFKMVREVSERFIASWAQVIPALPEVHYADGTVRFPAMAPTLPLYSGGDIAGQSLVVYDGSGFGDCFFSVRWLPEVKRLSRAKRIVFVVRPELLTFAKSFRIDAEIVAHAGREYIPDGPASFAPLVFLTTLIGPSKEDLWHGPYISVPAALAGTWRERIDARRRHGTVKVGLVWEAGHFGVESLSWRNMKPESFAALSSIEGVSLVSLQKGHGESGYTAIPGAISFAPEITSFEDTAAIIANLDLVISVDSGVANLAGAMGTPVWVLLEPLHDGRYGLTDIPVFYPTMRVFRQRIRGDWTDVMAEVAEALRALVP